MKHEIVFLFGKKIANFSLDLDTDPELDPDPVPSSSETLVPDPHIYECGYETLARRHSCIAGQLNIFGQCFRYRYFDSKEWYRVIAQRGFRTGFFSLK
jgi:hypothetical protein